MTESETRVQVYTDPHGRVVREVDLHLVIVDESASLDPDLAPWHADQRSTATIAQRALDQAFEAATRGLAQTFDEPDAIGSVLSDASSLFDSADIVPRSFEDEWAFQLDDGEAFLRGSTAAAAPEPTTALLLAVGLLPVVTRRRRDVVRPVGHVAPNDAQGIGSRLCV